MALRDDGQQVNTPEGSHIDSRSHIDRMRRDAPRSGQDITIAEVVVFVGIKTN